MQNMIIPIDTRSLTATASGHFIKIGRFDLANTKHARMFSEALALHEKLIETMCIKAVVSGFNVAALFNGTMTINGVNFTCSAFARMRHEDILKAYAYILTIGEIALDENDAIIDAFFADAWGTAYVDAASERLRQIIQENTGDNVWLSDSIGPGYYGMAVTEMKTLFALLDYRAIGTSLTEHALIVPQKSCAGFYFAMTDRAALPGTACASCLGSKKNCRYCNIRTHEKHA